MYWTAGNIINKIQSLSMHFVNGGFSKTSAFGKATLKFAVLQG
jgi:hypothetical protein